MRRVVLPSLLLSAALPVAALAANDLSTVSERSGFQRTGRYDEVIALCRDFQTKYPKSVRCFDFGTTPEGRPMKALAVSTSGALTPAAARAKGLPVVLAQGGIHAGEIDGKDAGFLAIREMLQGKAAKGALDHAVLLFVPVFNIDGHENFRAWNRPNQRGPEEMGFRVTAQRYNLNRDYMKADAPEMQAMLRLVNAWDPLVEIDLHVTDGAKFQHDVSITGEPVNSGDMELRKVGRAVKDGLLERLATQGSKPVGFYPSFVNDDDPQSGFIEGPSTPRFSNGYYPLRNRVGILLETHSWRTYPERVRITRNGIVDVVELTAAHGREWLSAAHAADQRARKLGGTPVALSYRNTDDVRTIDFKGYAYQRRKSDISGGTMTEYDESKPQVWHIPLKDHVVADVEVVAPRGGYLVPAAWASIVEPKLKAHGIEYRRIARAMPNAAVESFRADTAKFSANSFEGHQPVTLAGHWSPDHRDLVAGALFVPIAQAKSRLLMGLLEPQAPDALAGWGDMNNAFESKEYMEAYVTEQEARKMLARDPALKQEFEQRLKNDADFAKSPQARLDFFYRRHPAYDPALRLYPVFRSDTVPH
ncbi:M14 family metallopeptidase [Solilutibacter silvestris]|uniref:Zinc carboxypeptidase n=1 Tax=Solilutibacter silvestris TaxID=1645665 RepID=A0A2K1PY93_9GAMM|nr:M14 family metallopeptidase [Lysobacter silvestris]PNS07765.1 Zinc carboxypeptidase [Lysobacter silvestris]